VSGGENNHSDEIAQTICVEGNMKHNEVFGNAVWLGAEKSNASGIYILRGRFHVGKVVSATLRVLGLGFFHCYINGTRVGDELFLPLNSEFEPRKDYPIGEILSGHHIYVPEFDIAPLLREGENVIAVHFGGGWYTFGTQHYGKEWCSREDESKFGEAKAIWRIFGEAEDGGLGGQRGQLGASLCRIASGRHDDTFRYEQ